jgi:uncharacterized protein YciI
MAVVLLTYDYVDDILERRAPHRAGHLALIERFASERGLAVAGAVGDPPTGALFVFADETDPASAAADFAAADPYVTAGLVRSHTIEPWTVVANTWVSGPEGG